MRSAFLSPLKSPAASTSPDIHERIGAWNVPSPTPSITRTAPGALADSVPTGAGATVTAFAAGALPPVDAVVLAPAATPDVGLATGTATLPAGVTAPFAAVT